MNPTLIFFAIAGVLVAIALAFVLPTLWRPRFAGGVQRARLNAAIYREHLDDVERDRVLGIISPEAAETSRNELQQRLLADVHPEPLEYAGTTGRRTAALLVLILPVLAALLYTMFGNLSQVGTSSEASTTVTSAEALQARVRERPADARAWVLLARARMERSEFEDAAVAYRSAIAASPRVAEDAAVLCEYADALAMAQGGSLQGRPAALVMQALAIDGRHPQALEMAGSAAYERARYAEAAELWQMLLWQLAPETDRYRELAAAIESARQKSTRP